MDPQAGQLINNKYRLVRLIGDGGMGTVWESNHELLGTSVALKFLHSNLARRKGLVDRFLQEAQVSARIKSSHVVRVSDVDRPADGLAFMVMELVEGKTLQLLYEELHDRGEKLGYGGAFEMMLQLMEGVSAAHRLGIVHRDLKPDNVMLSKDSKGRTVVKILDFGIAKLKASGEIDKGLTRPGVVMGTPEYMAPEQAFSADRVDGRADVFSLGVMFFEMLSGRRPVGGDNAHSIAAQYLEGQVPKLRDLKPTVALELAAAVHKAMGAKPEDRFDSVDEFQAAIEPFAPEGTWPRTPVSPETIVENDAKQKRLAKEALAKAGEPVAKTVPPEHAPFGSARDDSPPTRGVATEKEGAPAPLTTDEKESADAAGDEAGAAEGADESDDRGEPRGDEAKDAQGHVLGAGTDEHWPLAPAKGAPKDAPADEASDGGDDQEQAAAEQAAAASPVPVDPDRPGGTMVGDTKIPSTAEAHPLRDGAGGTFDGGYPGAPSFVAQDRTHGGMMAPGRARAQRSGPSIVSILGIAALLSGVVVGGVYLAHRASREEDAGNDPPQRHQADVIPANVKTTRTVDTPPPSKIPANVVPPSSPVKPATPSSGTPLQPNSNPNKPPPGAPSGDPWILPSALPPVPGLPAPPQFPGLPFPGQPSPPPPSQPQPPPPVVPPPPPDGPVLPRMPHPHH